MRKAAYQTGTTSPASHSGGGAHGMVDAGIFTMIQAGLDKIDQGISIFDADLKLVFSNARLHKLLDLPDSLMVPGTDFAELIRYNAERGEYGIGDTQEMVRERVAVARQFKAHTLERTRPSGVVLRISGWPLPGGGFATVYTDITEQRRRELSLEARLMRQTEDFRRSEERLRLIANEVPAGIAYLDKEQNFGFVNMRFASAYGRAPSDFVDLPPAQVLLPRTLETVQPYFDRAIAGEALDFDLEIEFPDGRILDTRTFLRPERDNGHDRSGFYVLTINITRQKQAASALLRGQKMEALGQLSSGIAHDFNNLLTVILGNLQPLEPQLDEMHRTEMLEPAIRAARRGADLTRRLLAVARRQPLEPSPVDITEIAQNIAKLVRPSLPEDALMTITAPDQPCYAFVDPAQFETSLLNLAVNARDALGADGLVDIVIAEKKLNQTEAGEFGIKPGRYIELKVTDNGSGMSDKIIDRAFDPFFSTKENHERSGLGLSIVHGFAQDSQGSIRLQSREGEGSCFTLFLPACDAGPAIADEPLGALPEELKDGLVLLVDDDDEVRSVLRRDLIALGCRIIEADNAPEAFELARTVKDIRLVLSDIAMPGAWSGVELARRLTLSTPQIKLILMTGFGLEGMCNPGVNCKILQKPFGRRTLLRAFHDSFAKDTLPP